MFSFIISMIREFERNHGHRPQVICLNPRHMQQFMKECPDLFAPDTALPLGFRIMILPESELPHPKALWLPPRTRKASIARTNHEPELISWATKKRVRTEG